MRESGICFGGERCRCEECREEVLTVTIDGTEYHVADDWADLEDNGTESPLQCQGCADRTTWKLLCVSSLHRAYKLVCEACGETHYIHWTPRYNTVF